MADDHLDKSSLMKFAGLTLGIVIGGLIGPIVFIRAGLNIAAAASAGSLLGAILGFAAVSALLSIERRRRDYDLQHAAEAVKNEAGLPESITIKVKDGRITLEGEVEDNNQRSRAEEVMSTIPGAKGVINRLRLKPGAGQVTVSTDEIRRQIEDRLVRRAELDAKGIHVLLNNGRVVLEGAVRSPAEASDAENAVWNIPGVVEVENRLAIAA